MSTAKLEIHHINVSQGDSTLIIIRNLEALKAKVEEWYSAGEEERPGLPGDEIDYLPYAVANAVPLDGTVKKAVLIDGGVDEMGGSVIDYLITQGVLKESDEGSTNHISVPNLTIIVTHLHDDHYAGLRCLLMKRNPAYVKPRRTAEVTAVTEETQPMFLANYMPADIYVPQKAVKASALGNGFVIEAEGFSAKIDGFEKKNYQALLRSEGEGELLSERLTPDDFEANAIVLDDDTVSPIKMYCVAADGVVCGPEENTKVADIDKDGDINAFSSVFVLEYGSFRYLLGGDIAGDTGEVTTDNISSSHIDVETSLTEALKSYFKKTEPIDANTHKFLYDGYCTGFKASHHASASSNSNLLLATLHPCFTAIPSGFYSKFHYHPTNNNMNRFSPSKTATWTLDKKPPETNTITNIFITEIAEKNKNKNTNIVKPAEGKIMGDIVIRPLDESIEEVYESAEQGAELKIQIYGSGEFTSDSIQEEYLSALFPVDEGVSERNFYPHKFFTVSDKH